MTAATLLPALIGGLLTGAVYALAALGFTLAYRLLHVVNAAHGSLLLGAMSVAWFLASRLGIDALASLPLVSLILFASGYVLQATLLARVRGPGPRAGTIATLAVALILDGAGSTILGNGRRSLHTPYSDSVLAVGPLLLPMAKLAGCIVAMLIGGLLWLFMTRTDTGLSVRAVADEADAARLVGIYPARMQALAFGIAAACLGAAACLLLPGLALDAQSLDARTGHVLLLVTVTSVLLGGLGSISGAVLGGLGVGVAESLGRVLLGGTMGGAAVASVLLGALLLSPSGRRETGT